MASSPVSRVVYNGKRSGGPRSPGTGSEIFTPAHEENVRFIYEAFKPVDLGDLKRRNTQDAKKS
uniref:MAPK regulated corepressor interacting protein 1 n=1 Tax=Dromaius novaehollandiae TaxID=8790 RepID=A0A8C4P1W3_DRONO